MSDEASEPGTPQRKNSEGEDPTQMCNASLPIARPTDGTGRDHVKSEQGSRPSELEGSLSNDFLPLSRDSAQHVMDGTNDFAQGPSVVRIGDKGESEDFKRGDKPQSKSVRESWLSISEKEKALHANDVGIHHCLDWEARQRAREYYDGWLEAPLPYRGTGKTLVLKAVPAFMCFEMEPQTMRYLCVCVCVEGGREGGRQRSALEGSIVVLFGKAQNTHTCISGHTILV